MIGIAGWLVAVGLVLAWEGLAVTLHEPGWPSMSDMLRAVTRPVIGRWLLFAFWLWLGWHLFMRGWNFFLSGPGARTPPPGASKSVSQLLTEVTLPLMVCFLGWFVLVAAARRYRLRRTNAAAPAERSVTTGQRLRYLAVIVTFGYLLFIALIGVYAVVSGQLGSGVLTAAIGQGAFLAFAVAIPVYLVTTIVLDSYRSRRARDHPR